MSKLSGKVILVVDDEPDLREIICEQFEMEGATTLSARNGTEAYQLILSNTVNAVVSDVRMPGGDGIDLLDRIKERDPHFPIVILITGNSDLSESQAIARGAEAVFSKPFDRDKLTEAVVKALASPNVRWPLIKRRKKGVVSGAENHRVDVKFKIALLLKTLKININATVMNIGRGGIFIALEKGLPSRGDLISFEFSLGPVSADRITGRGVVRWVRPQPVSGLPSGFGLEFQELAPKCSDRIIALIESERAKAGIAEG